MRPPPRLRLQPRPSRIDCALTVAACLATSTLLALLPLPVAAHAAGAAAIVIVLGGALHRRRGRGVPRVIEVGIDRTIVVTERNGRARAGSIHEASYVGVWLTTIVWRANDAPWWRPARVLLVLPDTLPPDDFRRLRVILRYGWPVADRATNGVEAG